MIPDTLIEQERQLELEMLDRGVERYRNMRLTLSPHHGIPEKRQMVNLLGDFIDAIKAYRQEIIDRQCKAVKHGKDIWPVFFLLEPEQIGLTVLTSVFDAAYSKAVTLQSMVGIIGANLESVAQMQAARKHDPDSWRLAQRQMKKRWNPRTARRFFQIVTNTNRLWTLRQRRLTGAKCLSLLLETTDILDLNVVPGKYASVQLKEDFLIQLNQQHETLELLRPFLLPMIIPPADWTPTDEGFSGGYIYHNVSLIKSQNWGETAVGITPSPAALEAINTIQRTGYQINWPVFRVQQQLWEMGGDRCGLPPRDQRSLPEPRKDNMTPEELTEWRTNRRLAWIQRRQDVSGRIAQLYRLMTVQKLKDLGIPSFYFVWTFDWRGRMYPVTTALSPQGSDLDKGILLFSEAVPQTEEGRRWLKIHAANCFGEDKIPLSERVRWADDRLAQIHQATQDPLAHKWWMQADKPFMFLAACFELMRKDGKTQLPVNQDGSCNGLQHLSAMGRDEYGGQFVNLLPADRPQDIYQRVADEVQKSFDSWEGYTKHQFPTIDRKLVKRAVMTYPYSVTVAGITDQFMADGHLDHVDTGLNRFLIAQQLTVWVWAAIQKVVLRGADIMSWLKQVAEVANDANVSIPWTTPAGMQVTQRYIELTKRRIALPGLTNTLWFLETPETDQRLRKRKQTSGIAPNFVHSFDAAHLMLTVNAAKTRGINSFNMVHDSYGTHAPHASLLGQILRDEFIQMYTPDRLREFRDSVQQAVGDAEIPEPPEFGVLDLEQIRQSEYFFA